MSWRSRAGLSDAQANAEAVDKRERKYRKEHDASFRAPRDPETLSELKAEFRNAYEAESVGALQSNDNTESDGSPRWTSGFRAYITGSAFAREGDGAYLYPMRASIAKLAEDRHSAANRRAAEFCYLLRLNGDFDHVATWRTMLGIFREDEFITGTADPLAVDFLRRWWRFYVRASEPVVSRPTVVNEAVLCEHPTPDCPHGMALAAA